MAANTSHLQPAANEKDLPVEILNPNMANNGQCSLVYIKQKVRIYKLQHVRH
jgi:hypothetical protein